MRFEVRRTVNKEGVWLLRGLILIAESEEESGFIDQVLGNEPDADGLCGEGKVQARLSDGYGEHYLYIPAEGKNNEL